MTLKADVAVVGAGAFGGWSALHLQESGLRTLLIDAWGAGNSRSSSGGETRIIRAGYGGQAPYPEWSLEALQAWKERQSLWGSRLLHPCGVMWISSPEEEHPLASREDFDRLDVPYEILSPEEVARRYPDFRLDQGEQALLELSAGVLMARKACRRVLGAFLEAGGAFEVGQASPPTGGGRLSSLALEGGRRVEADSYLFACGPWMPRLFPEILGGGRLEVTRQEVLFFSAPAGHASQRPGAMPAWYDFSHEAFYGLPSIEERGVKLARDVPGPPFDPDEEDRLASAEALERARAYLQRRLPAFARAPLVESRVCQYSLTPGRHIILDAHPAFENVYLAAGGSGHGFKHGPVVGRLASEMVRRKASSRPPQTLLAAP